MASMADYAGTYKNQREPQSADCGSFFLKTGRSKAPGGQQEAFAACKEIPGSIIM